MPEIKTLTVDNTTFDVVDANAVHFTEQTLTEEQKIQAISNIGAMSMTLLWENASPASSFEPQNIAVPTGAYEYTMVEGLNSLNWNGLAHAMGRIGHHATLNNGANQRAFKVHDGYVEFFNGKDIGTGAVGGDKMIPQKIWGIKGVIE